MISQWLFLCSCCSGTAVSLLNLPLLIGGRNRLPHRRGESASLFNRLQGIQVSDMDTERTPYPVPQTQASAIDPRLQESVQVPQQYSNLPPITYIPAHGLPPPPPPQQQQQPSQHSYSAPQQWQQDGYNPYYGPPPDQQPPPMQQAANYQAYHINSEAHPPSAETGFNNDTKRPRACEACRGLKVRCEPDPGTGPCKRCRKANRNCVITAPSRKRQKKTDSRVAELERKIDALTASLHATKEGNVSGSEDDGYGDGDTPHVEYSDGRSNQPISPYTTASAGANRKRRMSEYQQDGNSGSPRPSASEAMSQTSPANVANMGPRLFAMPKLEAGGADLESTREADTVMYGEADVVGRGIVHAETANGLFTHYTDHMAPHMPIVVFSPDTSPDTIRRRSPVLFLAILSVASGQEYPDLQATLTKEIEGILADRVFVHGEKSLELVQALQVVTIWYWPEPNGDSKYYQYIHMTAVMAIDLGMFRRQPLLILRKEQILGLPKPKSYLSDPCTTECRRAWLGCYLLCSR